MSYKIGDLAYIDGNLSIASFVDCVDDMWFQVLNTFHDDYFTKKTIARYKLADVANGNDNTSWWTDIDIELFEEGKKYSCPNRARTAIGIKKTKLAEKMLDLTKYYEKDGYLYELNKKDSGVDFKSI